MMTNTDQICSLSKLLKNKPTKNKKNTPAQTTGFYQASKQYFST